LIGFQPVNMHFVAHTLKRLLYAFILRSQLTTLRSIVFSPNNRLYIYDIEEKPILSLLPCLDVDAPDIFFQRQGMGGKKHKDSGRMFVGMH